MTEQFDNSVPELSDDQISIYLWGLLIIWIVGWSFTGSEFSNEKALKAILICLYFWIRNEQETWHLIRILPTIGPFFVRINHLELRSCFQNETKLITYLWWKDGGYLRSYRRTCIWKSFSVVFKTETKYYWRLTLVRFETIQVTVCWIGVKVAVLCARQY